MKRRYGIWLGPASPKTERMLEAVREILSVTPHRVESAVLVLWDEDRAKQIVTKMVGVGIDTDLGMRTEYDLAELDSADLLRLDLASLHNTGAGRIKRKKIDARFPDNNEVWGWHSGPVTGTLFFEYAYAKGRDLLVEQLSYALIVSRRLREFLEENRITGIAYHPLVNYEQNSKRRAKSELSYFLAQCTHTLPPLDPRVLVGPWRVPDGQPDAGWNFPVLSEYYYTREALSSYSDVNRVWTEELGKRIAPALIVSQRFRRLLSSWRKIKVEYEPVFIVSANEDVRPQPNGWIWSPTQTVSEHYPQEIISLAEAREKYRG